MVSDNNLQHCPSIIPRNIYKEGQDNVGGLNLVLVTLYRALQVVLIHKMVRIDDTKHHIDYILD